MTLEPVGEGVRVVVAVATYRRPELLESLLPSLVAQASGLDRRCRVLVVDNDPAESARAVVDRADGSVTYVGEARPGIAAARNRALEVADDWGAEAVVFIDDDEQPAERWLQTLVDAWDEWGVAAVAGPVVSHFQGRVDPWVEAAPTFRRPRRATGQRLPGAATNNLILSTAVLTRHGLRFDDAFGLTGGSDTMLTRSLVALGEEIRWCDEAEMHEVVPADRATRDWVLQRHRRTGNVAVRVELAVAARRGDASRGRVRRVVRPLGRMAKGVARIVLGALTGDLEKRVLGACDVATGRGALDAARGGVVTEYARPGSAVVG